MFSIVMFPLMFCIDFFFPLFPTGCGLPAVILEYKGGAGTLCSATACVFICFFNCLHMKWSVKDCDDSLVVRLKSMETLLGRSLRGDMVDVMELGRWWLLCI